MMTDSDYSHLQSALSVHSTPMRWRRKAVLEMYLNIIDAQFSDESDFRSRYTRRFGTLHGLKSSF
jgi:hypothetical protein